MTAPALQPPEPPLLLPPPPPSPPWPLANSTLGATPPCYWLQNASGLAPTGGRGGGGVADCSGGATAQAINFWIGQGLSGCASQLLPLVPAVVVATFALLGIISNALLTAVWSRPGLRGASTYYLATLSVFASLHLALNSAFWGASALSRAAVFQGVTACKVHLVLTMGTTYTVTALTLVVVLQRLLIMKQLPPPPLADMPTSPTSAVAPSTVPPSSPEEDPDDPVQHVAILIAVITFTLGIMGGMHVIFWGGDERCTIRHDLSWQYAIYGLTTDGLFGIAMPIAILATNVVLRNRIAKAEAAAASGESAEPRLGEQALSCVLMIRTMSCYRAACLLVGTLVGLCEFLFLPLVATVTGGLFVGDRAAYATYCLVNQLVALLVKSHFVMDALLCALSSASFRRQLRVVLRGSGGAKLPTGSARASRTSRLSCAAAAAATHGGMQTSHSACSGSVCVASSAAAAQAYTAKPVNGSAGGEPVKYDVVVSARGLTDGSSQRPAAV